jgi:hypothetical protein
MVVRPVAEGAGMNDEARRLWTEIRFLGVFLREIVRIRKTTTIHLDKATGKITVTRS